MSSINLPAYIRIICIIKTALRKFSFNYMINNIFLSSYTTVSSSLAHALHTHDATHHSWCGVYPVYNSVRIRSLYVCMRSTLAPCLYHCSALTIPASRRSRAVRLHRYYVPSTIVTVIVAKFVFLFTTASRKSCNIYRKNGTYPLNSPFERMYSRISGNKLIK